MSLTTSVIIINYNYDKYVCHAIDSVLAQTVPVDEIIIVDDGSTDDSRDLITQKYSNIENCKLVFKENEGQLSAFNKGVEYATKDIIFFLDSDDLYKRNHVESSLKVYESDVHVDYVFSAFEYSGKLSGPVFNPIVSSRLIRQSSLGVYLKKFWLGGPTSVVSIKRTFASKIFPFPGAWRRYSQHHADVGLVLGSSIMGASKYYLAEPNVYYRAHEENIDLGKKRTKLFEDRMHLYFDEVSNYYFSQLSSKDQRITAIALKNELKSFSFITFSEYKGYMKLMVKSRSSLFVKLYSVISSSCYFIRHWSKKSPPIMSS